MGCCYSFSNLIVSDKLMYNESGGNKNQVQKYFVMLINYKSVADRIKAVQTALIHANVSLRIGSTFIFFLQ